MFWNTEPTKEMQSSPKLTVSPSLPCHVCLTQLGTLTERRSCAWCLVTSFKHFGCVLYWYWDRITAWSEAMFVSFNFRRSKLSLIKYALVTAVLIDLSQADTLLPLCIPPAAENSKVNRCKFPVAKNAPIISYLHLQLWQVEASVSFVELLNTDINIWIIVANWMVKQVSTEIVMLVSHKSLVRATWVAPVPWHVIGIGPLEPQPQVQVETIWLNAWKPK